MHTLTDAIKLDIDINKITDVKDVEDSKAQQFMIDFENKTREFASVIRMKWKVYHLRKAEYPIVVHNARFHEGPARPYILDAGFNIWFDYYLAKYHNARVVSNDIEYTDSFQKAIRSFEKTGLDVRPVVGKAQEIDIKDNTFDYVFCISVLEHVPFEDRPKCIDNFIRMTKPGGRIIVTVDTGTVYQEILGTQAYDAHEVFPQLIEPFLDRVTIGDFDFDWNEDREYIRTSKIGDLTPAVFTLIKTS